MSRSPDLAYHFATEAQWRAGLRDGLRVHGGAVRPLDALRALPLQGSGPADGGARTAVDACGRLVWVRPGDRSVRRWEDLGVAEVGRLVRGPTPVALAINGGLLWLATPRGVERHDAHDLQRLGVTTHHVAGTDLRPIGVCRDGADGIWVLVARQSGCLTLVHLDCWGAVVGRPLRVPLAGDLTGTVAAAPDGRVVVVPSRSSRVAVLVRPHPTADVRPVPLAAGPDVLAVALDREHRVVLLRADDAGAVVEIITIDGDQDERHVVELPRGFGPVSAVVAGQQLALVGAGGLALLDPSSTSTTRRVSTFVTPALHSPLGRSRPGGRRGKMLGGWNRAEVDVALPWGTTLELAWAATDQEAVVQETGSVLADASLSPGDRLAALDSLLLWHTQDRVVYESAQVDDGAVTVAERLAATIDRPEPYLWVRVTLTTAVGAEPPTLAGLHVSYPSTSLLDDLPAVYCEDAASASQLRRLLAPFEVLLDGLDARIDRLPARIDPATADDEWTTVLLGWLGMPLLEDLVPDRRRALLRELPRLQQDRGTPGALVRALEIVTGSTVRVRDHGDEAAWWFLPRAGRPIGARLGVDTVVAGAMPQPFHAGAAILGESPLGVPCVDPGRVIDERNGLVEIRVELPADERAATRPIVDRILTVFAPAHCRVLIDDRPGPGLSGSRAIGVDLHLAGSPSDGPDSRLHGDEHWRLGASTELGAWSLPAPTTGVAVLDAAVLGDDPTHLT
ncbi:phage tail-like protein [Nocardioides sp. BE266]|uniref:phage tail protein n=1 Tax=Nocardioides sp. BE266 TaxID=2817725 RepID=UPI00286242A2|nr:phage tail protein [Nocardioides sp. BE266]MDR7254312.1 phage tail-like protein [Nocardioides sp. BE266]